MNLNAQYDDVRARLQRARPRSKRRTKLESNLITIQLKRLKQDIKAGRAKK